MANVEFGTGKTVLILTTVAACFAILWPKIFYPMLVSSPAGKTQGDNLNGCCDVIFETDVNAIKVMTEICGTILNRHPDFDPKLVQAFNQGQLSKEVVAMCRKEVINVCGIDIAEFLSEKVRIGRTYRQILEEIRSFNTSVCLRRNFGVSPGLLGTPRLMRTWDVDTSRHLRQERPLHLRPEMMHPALREKGRAIPHTHVVPKVPLDKDQQPPNRPLPMPGMRPPLGGAGHVVAAPKGGGTMSIVMPLYTIGIVIFFMYTIMKVFVKKSGSGTEFKDFHSDPEFRRVVFAEDYSNGCAGVNGEGVHVRESSPHLWKTPSDDSTRLVMTAISGLLAEVDQQLGQSGDTQTQYSTEPKGEEKTIEEVCTEKEEERKEGETKEKVDEKEFVSKELLWDESDEKGDIVHEPVGAQVEEDDTKPKIKVVGLETVASCEGGLKWSRPPTPNLGDGGHSRSTTPITPAHSPEPQNIFLEGTLPSQSKLLVTDSETQAVAFPISDDPEPPIILSGKMTLSVISLDTIVPEDLHHAQPAVIDETGQSSTQLELGQEEQEAEQLEEDEAFPNLNESQTEEDPTGNYTTATMSAEAVADETEETAADISNLDTMDTAEDQEEIEDEEEDREEDEDEDQLWNGEREGAPPQSNIHQHQR